MIKFYCWINKYDVILLKVFQSSTNSPSSAIFILVYQYLFVSFWVPNFTIFNLKLFVTDTFFEWTVILLMVLVSGLPVVHSIYVTCGHLLLCQPKVLLASMDIMCALTFSNPFEWRCYWLCSDLFDQVKAGGDSIWFIRTKTVLQSYIIINPMCYSSRRDTVHFTNFVYCGDNPLVTSKFPCVGWAVFSM